MANFSMAAWVATFPWLTFSLAAASACLAILILTPLARRTGWVDKPNERKPHSGEIPLIGGPALLVSLLVLLPLLPLKAIAPPGYWAGALLLFVVALCDDRRPVRARYRFMAQVTAATAGLALGGQILPGLGDLLGIGVLSAWWLVVPVSVFGCVAVINAVNFTDGADGLCAGLGFISLFWLLVAVVSAANAAQAAAVLPAPYAHTLLPLGAAMMGGLAGFMLFNMRSPWRRSASVFLGDSGSMLIGFTLAWFCIHVTSSYGPASVRPVVCLWIMAVPLLDSASCIFRRSFAGEAPMKADLKHLHHLLRRLGLSTGRAVFSIHVASFVCGLIGVSGWWLGIEDRWLFGSFALLLFTFVAGTTVIWRRIDGKGQINIGVAA